MRVKHIRLLTVSLKQFVSWFDRNMDINLKAGFQPAETIYNRPCKFYNFIIISNYMLLQERIDYQPKAFLNHMRRFA